MEQPQELHEQHSGTNRIATVIRNSASIKIAVISFIILVLLIPGSMITSLIYERQIRRDNVVQEISEKWGQKQVVSGPILSVPVEFKQYFTKDKPVITTEYLHFLPQQLQINGSLDPEIRYRGIFTAPLYTVSLDISGTFSADNFDTMSAKPEDIQWHKAFLSMGMSDMAGIRKQITGTINDQEVAVTPGITTQDVFHAGVSIPHSVSLTDELHFHFKMQLNGSDELRFLPLGQTTSVHLTSSWNSPSFSGKFLPAESQVTDDGFSADWHISHFNRDYPQQWKGPRKHLENTGFGVRIIQPTDIYQKATRTAKYALMFIVFTFTAFFVGEIMTSSRVHPVQYMLVGFAVTCFYVLLLAFSEHVGFNAAYGVASTSVVLMIGAYVRSILGAAMSLVTTLLLCCLYSYLYVTLQLEDYALLMGSIGLFFLLGLVMFVTRKVDWYSLGKS